MVKSNLALIPPKIFFIGVFLFIFQTLSAMKPGPALIVECPSCGAEKSLMTLISGNSFGSLLWSDGYHFAPMAPTLSPVQKCMDCKSYFMLISAPYRYSEQQSDYSLETGLLSYNEIKEAFIELLKTDLSPDEELQLRLEFLYRFNDAFRDSENISLPLELTMDKERENEDYTLFQINLKKLISIIEEQSPPSLLLAELYREMGDFDQAISVLRDFVAIGKVENIMKSLLLHNAEAGNKNLILIDSD